MREHEVPTHVQAEDKVLLGFTFPQVVAVTAVCAISYGAYRYAPVGPSEVRMAIAVVLGLVGVAMTVGKIGGRRLPLVAADLLKYRLGARVYAGPVAQLVRAETPAPPHPVKSGPGPLSLMAKRAGRGLGRLRKNRKTRKNKERRNGRMRWFGKRRGKDGGNRHGQDHRAETLETRNRKPRVGWIPVVALAVLMAAVVAVPQSALADDHEPGGTRSTSRSPSLSPDGGYSSRRSPSPATAPPSPFGPPPPWTSASGHSAGRREAGCASGARQPWPRGSASTTRFPSTVPRRPSPCPGRTPSVRPGR